MAVAYDTSTKSGAWNNAESSVTWSHTCSGSDRVLVVAVTSYAKKTTGATYNGVAMTLVSEEDQGATLRVSVFCLKNPASGANNVVVSLSGTDYVRTSAVSFTGADQTTNPQSYIDYPYNVGDPATWTVTLETTGNTWLCLCGYTNSTPTAGANSVRWQTANELTIFGSDTSRSAGSNSVNAANCGAHHGIMVAINEVLPPLGPVNIKSVDGVVKASVKSINGVLIASVKTIDGVS